MRSFSSLPNPFRYDQDPHDLLSQSRRNWVENSRPSRAQAREEKQNQRNRCKGGQQERAPQSAWGRGETHTATCSAPAVLPRLRTSRPLDLSCQKMPSLLIPRASGDSQTCCSALSAEEKGCCSGKLLPFPCHLQGHLPDRTRLFSLVLALPLPFCLFSFGARWAAAWVLC